ncbi:MAG: DUF1844 domain-containing protein [Ignavibacteriales bacterium]|nr:DUF1844 domain-containing protein [Ignavibacteriales bacterium]
MTPEEKKIALFGGLLLMIHSAAMQQLGKVKNPITDKIERDLEQAQMSIDMLDMIAEKTKGNLTEDEAKLLKTLLQELKLNYVDEAAKSQSQPGTT